MSRSAVICDEPLQDLKATSSFHHRQIYVAITMLIATTSNPRHIQALRASPVTLQHPTSI